MTRCIHIGDLVVVKRGEVVSLPWKEGCRAGCPELWPLSNEGFPYPPRTHASVKCATELRPRLAILTFLVCKAATL